MTDQRSQPHESAESAELPPSIELAWGLRDRPTRGPKRALTLDQVVAAGIEVAEADGLVGVSMAKVAARLGVGTMSLYRYVSSKDDLLTLMVDAGLGPPPARPGDADPSDWRAELTRWATGIRAAYRAQPWSIRVPISGPPLGPNNVAWLEVALESLEHTGLSETDKVSTVLLLSGFARSEAMLTTDIEASLASGSPPPAYGRLLAQLTTAADHPAIHRVIAAGDFDDDVDAGHDLDHEFEFGLARILDGVELLIERATTG